jgi:hypothetical protein
MWLSLRFTWILSSSGMLRSAGRFCTDFSGLRIGATFKGQDIQETKEKNP